MEVIRSNYSTLSKIAQAEAPTAPEYPFTDMFNAYRQILGRLEDSNNNNPNKKKNKPGENYREGPGGLGIEDIMTSAGSSSSTSSTTSSTTSGTSSSPPQSNHTMSFQRILKHFFDDYFQRDADDETSADMAQRWVAFARTGDPNYEDSKVEWVPWRYIPGDQKESMDDLDRRQSSSGSRSGSSKDPLSELFTEDLWMETSGEDDSWEDDEARLGRVLRERALQALNMEVIEEDELRTELRKTKVTKPDPDNPFFSLKVLSYLGITSPRDHHEAAESSTSSGNLPRDVVRQAQKAAQEMGVLGTGLKGDDRGGGIFQLPQQTSWDDDFFPQLLELMWPPEGRLVERDCTCDFWDRIRCKFDGGCGGCWCCC